MKSRKKIPPKKKNKICAKHHCTGKAIHGKFCEKCRRRDWVKNNPERDKFNNLKGNAKRRKIPFNLSFAEFKLFCDQNDYVSKVGRSKTSMTIERIRRHEGYQFDNLQALTNTENVHKYNYYERPVPEGLEENPNDSENDLSPAPSDFTGIVRPAGPVPF